MKSKRIGVSELTKKLHTTRGNVYDIFKRETMDTGMLLKLCRIVDCDFFDDYYREKPLREMRGGKIQQLKKDIQAYKRAIAGKDQRIQYLEERR